MRECRSPPPPPNLLWLAVCVVALAALVALKRNLGAVLEALR